MAEQDFSEKTLELARETMKGQLRDLVLDHMMHEKKNSLPWNLWPEDQQHDLIQRVEMSIGNAIENAVQIIARDGKQAVPCTIEQIVLKDGMKLVLTTPNLESSRVTLGGQVGQLVLITVAEDAAYQGGQERKPEPNQTDMFRDQGDDEQREAA